MWDRTFCPSGIKIVKSGLYMTRGLEMQEGFSLFSRFSFKTRNMYTKANRVNFDFMFT